MKLARLAEHSYIKQHIRGVKHITIDPRGPGVVRVHMIPPDTTWNRSVPYLLILNGMYIMPIGMSWAIMFSCLIDRLEPTDGEKIAPGDWDNLLKKAVDDTMKVYPGVEKSFVRNELDSMVNGLKSIALLGRPTDDLKVLTLKEYMPHMTAPHRMDLMVSAMTKGGEWHCNQKCLHCYAAGQSGSETPELDTDAR